MSKTLLEGCPHCGSFKIYVKRCIEEVRKINKISLERKNIQPAQYGRQISERQILEKEYIQCNGCGWQYNTETQESGVEL